MLKKTLAVLAALALVLSLAACNREAKQPESTPPAAESTTAAKEPEKSTEPEPSEAESTAPVSESATESEETEESTAAQQSKPETSATTTQARKTEERPTRTTKPVETTKPERTEPKVTETEKPLTPDPEPGVPVPENWPLEVPSPVTGEVLACGWAPDRSFCTTDIVYKQADIDAYGKRLESYGFERQEKHEYGEDWPDALVYSNGRWDVIVAEENETFEYTYVNFYPLFDVVKEGYEGQPEGWPEAGDF
ncbi:MAG: hypothetical protein QM296_11605 [Bacillota bacterium]|nr:hypothetical protein [Bacillota bacterium]